MIKHGSPPYLECSSRGDKRFSAFCARISGRGFNTIEEIFQSAKKFEPEPGVNMFGHMINWRNAKGRHAINQDEVTQLYETLWREYLAESPGLIEVLKAASGLSDMFGTVGHCCQATTLWKIRNENLQS